jgi:hypothetical protein
VKLYLSLFLIDLSDKFTKNKTLYICVCMCVSEMNDSNDKREELRVFYNCEVTCTIHEVVSCYLRVNLDCL